MSNANLTYKEILNKFNGYLDYLEELEKIEDKFSWEKAKRKNTKKSYEKYLLRYSNGIYSFKAKQKIDKFIDKEKKDELEKKEEEKTWKIICKNNTKESYEDYLIYFPNGMFKREALTKLSSIKKELEHEKNVCSDYIYKKYLHNKKSKNEYKNTNLIGKIIFYHKYIGTSGKIHLFLAFSMLVLSYFLLFLDLPIKLIESIFQLNLHEFLNTFLLMIVIILIYKLILNYTTNLKKMPLKKKNLLMYYLFPFNKINYNKFSEHVLVGENGIWLYNEVENFSDIALYSRYFSANHVLNINSRYKVLKKFDSKIKELFDKSNK